MSLILNPGTGWSSIKQISYMGVLVSVCFMQLWVLPSVYIHVTNIYTSHEITFKGYAFCSDRDIIKATVERSFQIQTTTTLFTTN
jgi:hypothetical protein